MNRKKAPSVWKALFRFRKSAVQIMRYEFLHQFITINLADEAPCVVVIGDVGRVLGKKLADDLVDWIIALFLQSVINRCQNALHFGILIIDQAKFSGSIEHLGCLLSVAGKLYL